MAATSPPELRFERVSLDFLPAVIDALRSDFPHSLVYFQLLGMYKKCAEVVPERDIRLFLPGGVVDKHGTSLLFVPDHRYGVNFHTAADYDQNLLKRMILGIKDIDWSIGPTIGPNHDRFFSLILSIKASENLTIAAPLNPADNLLMDIETALNLDTRDIEGFELRPLAVTDAKFIDDRWPHKNEFSFKYIEDVLKTGGGYGLYCRGTDELVCWAMHSLVGGVGMIQTDPKYRRRGLASLVARVLTKKIAEMGIIPQVQIKCGIAESLAMFTSMGYKRTHLVHWHRYRRFGHDETKK